MWINVRILLRQIRRHKLFTLITVSCLTAGVALAMLATAYALYELSYDQPAPDAKPSRIVRMKQIYGDGVRQESVATIREDLLQQVRQLPEVEAVCPINQAFPGIRYRQQAFKLEHLVTANDVFFEFFPVKLLQGQLTKVLSQPKSIVLTESLAQRIGTPRNLLGATVTLGKDFDYEVVAIIADWPKNSHLEVEAIIPNLNCPFGGMLGFQKKGEPMTVINLYETYLRLTPRADLAAVEQKLSALASDLIKRRVRTTIRLTPLQDIYMSAETSKITTRHGDMRRILLLAAIATFSLLIACINYVNLANCNATRRAREIGIKKTVGAGRLRLFGEYILESVLLTMLSAGLAGLLAWLLLPVAQRLLMTEFTLAPLFRFPAFLWLIPGIAGLGVLAGTYPALILSGFRPLSALAAHQYRPGRPFRFGQLLIVVQFAIAVVFIIGALIISGQLSYVSRLDLGYNHDHLLHVQAAGLDARLRPRMQDRLRQNPRVKAAAFSRGIPGKIQVSSSFGGVTSAMLIITPEFMETYQLEMVAGRALKPGDENRGCLINEVAARALGTEPVIGRRYFEGPEIIGVVKNFHFASLHTPIEPLMMDLSAGDYWEDLTIRLSGTDLPVALAEIESLWKELCPGLVFDYTFFDDRLAREYGQEQRLGELIRYAAAITILMSCFGLAGLALFNAESRLQEIGVRKVLGAPVGGLVMRLTRHFAGLVLAAILPGIPVAWYIMNRWLENFAYHLKPGWEIFALAGGLVLAVAVLTVASQVFRAARTDPVKILRHE